ncbi:MAG: AAA family ATPase, partial [Deltaproteobacteria bacterium]|nr:AAA family ATPase [Deltaproteobacteria bacterium]
MGEQQICFETFRLDLASERLWGGEQPVHLRPKTFAVLRYLVERAGQLVLHEELLENVWSEAIVGGAVVQGCIRELRQALGDDAKTPRFIETVHGKGYRFIGKVVSSQQSGVSRAEQSSVQRPASSVQIADSAIRNPQSAIPLVGRDAELAQLHRALEKALNGERQLVFVTGEAGIGKTALVEMFLAGLSTQDSSALTPSTQHPTPSLWIGRGQCIEHFGAGEAYLPILEALGQLCRQPEGEHCVALLRQSAPLWLLQLPWLLDAAERESLRREMQYATKERMLRELMDVLDAVTVEKPIVLVLEDLHWGDPSTMDLLAALARRRTQARLLVIGAHRPVELLVQEHPLRIVKQELLACRRCEEVALPLLSETDVGAYLTMRFAGDVQSAAPWQVLARVLHQRTEGNPLFFITVVNELVSREQLQERAGHWEVGAELSATELGAPESIRQLIERRMERCSAAEQRLLEAASVAGAEFSTATLATVLETELGQVEEHCAGLARHGQLLSAYGSEEEPDGTVTTCYKFAHSLYQNVVYERVGAVRRLRLHQRIGECIEA